MDLFMSYNLQVLNACVSVVLNLTKAAPLWAVVALWLSVSNQTCWFRSRPHADSGLRRRDMCDRVNLVLHWTKTEVRLSLIKSPACHHNMCWSDCLIKCQNTHTAQSGSMTVHPPLVEWMKYYSKTPWVSLWMHCEQRHLRAAWACV